MVINFFGRRGSGKTTAIRGTLKFCRKPIIIVDVLGNYDTETLEAENFYELAQNTIQTTEIADTIEEISTWHGNKKEHTGIINLKTADPALAADYISSAIWEINGGTLILDEVDSISIKEGSCFDQYIRYGRNHSGDLITGCRRPAEIDKNITAAANKFYCFQTHEYRDIEYFYAIFGDRAEELMRVPRYSGLFMDYDNNLTGHFRIDISGQIYHLDEQNV